VNDDPAQHDAEQPGRSGLSRKLLLQRAGLVAATAGLAGCGVGEHRREVSTDVDASVLPAPPPRQSPLNCMVYSFFTPDEAATVDAFTARLIPGDAADPGAHEACVVSYIDAKLARFPSFATPTYFEAPFAKPVAASPGPQPGASDTILVSKKDLPRYGFQSGLTPQQTYRRGLRALDRFCERTRHARFVDLPPDGQDAVLEALETANPSAPSVARKQTDLADPRKALEEAKAKHARELATPEQRLLARIFDKPSAYGFFSTLQSDANEGFLADPIYGGNRDFAGWKLLGYPGIQRAWTPFELTHGPQRRRLQGLAQMPPMNPGVPQGHAVLPLRGTERTAR
jgi:gluconate 2-dehydrogenase gamma chain